MMDKQSLSQQKQSLAGGASRKLAFFASIAGILLGVVGVVFLLQILKPKTSGISIETNVPSSVFIDGKQVGRSPYDGIVSPHVAVVKLVPLDRNLASYETKIEFTAGVKTIVRRNFGQTDAASSGEIISFEKTPTDDFGISIVTSPDASSVILDGNPRGFSPIKISRVVLGTHQLSLSFLGYSDLTFSVKTVDGYRLVVIAKLAQLSEAQPQAEESQQVEILKGASSLKAREAPSTQSGEIGQVYVGEKYKLLSTSSDLTWYEVDLGGGKSGWILAQSATVSGVLGIPK